MTFQPLPNVTLDSAPFWEGGARGELRIMRCGVCRMWFHPPSPLCPACLSLDVSAEAASGRAIVATYTVNHQPWAPDMEVPYILAIVELVEQPDVRLMTRIVDCSPEAIAIGLAVEVVFEQADDVWLPLFHPVGSAS